MDNWALFGLTEFDMRMLDVRMWAQFAGVESEDILGAWSFTGPEWVMGFFEIFMGRFCTVFTRKHYLAILV